MSNAIDLYNRLMQVNNAGLKTPHYAPPSTPSDEVEREATKLKRISLEEGDQIIQDFLDGEEMEIEDITFQYNLHNLHKWLEENFG